MSIYFLDTEPADAAVFECGQVGGAGLDLLEDDSIVRHEATRVLGDQIISRLLDGPPAA